MAQLLIENGVILTVNDRFDIHEKGYLLVEDGTIAVMAAGEPSPAARRQAEQVIDADGQIVMPGLINAHVHLFQTLIRGLSDNRPLIPWLEEVAFPVYAEMQPEDIFLAVKMGIVENVKGGATAVTDNFTVRQSQEGYDAVFQAAQELGIRYKMARGYSDTGYPESLMETGDEMITSTRLLYDTWCKNDQLLSLDFSPNVVWSTTRKTLEKIVSLSRDWNIGIHIHTAEDKKENDLCLEQTGVRQVTWLDQLGVLGPRTQLAHGIWINEEEMELIADTGTAVVHNPVSNMFIGTGICPVPAMKKAGVRVALGSDGQAVNNGQEMLDVLKWAANLQKVDSLNPAVLPPDQVIRMACRNGAYAFGQPDLIGSLDPGKKADLILVEMNSSRLTRPTLNIPSLLVNLARSDDVSTVIINGKIIMQDREMLVVDEEKLKDKFQKQREALIGRARII